LIEIYNKNISLISSGNVYDTNKNYGEVEDVEKQIKKFLKRENLKTNLLVLKSLSNKIKELIGKYKEKVFEIEEIKAIKLALQRQILNEQIIRCNNSLESNVATNYNSNESFNSYLDEDNLLIKNNLILNPKEEIEKKGVTNILLRELINIKRTLKVSSKEIELIFKYPLNILKNEEGKKIKFSIELMQREEFCKTLLEDDLISSLLNQIRDIFSKIKNQKITKWILELDESHQHKNEMTKFIKYINDKLQIKKENYNKNNESNYLEELKSDEEKIGENDINNIINTPVEEINKKIKRKKNKKIEEEKIEENNEKNELKFKDIDEILNYINDDTDSKKGKKKGKKAKKNKNKNKEEKENKENNDSNVDELLHNFEKEFENFKNEIIQDSLFVYEINNKIKPCLSDNFLNSISII
jgi:hypothetical protein